VPNFFASPSGNDSNAGTSASPFRTISRATREAVTRGGSGTIRAANGLYDAGAGEVFPISIPPGYRLAGESRGATVIQYETPATGTGVSAIESGNGVRELTLRAGVPLPGGGGATCTNGIYVNTSDAVIQRVRVLPSRDLVAPFPWPPAPWPADVGLFFSAITSDASPRAQVRDCIIEWHMTWLSRNATVDGCVFRDSDLFIDHGTVESSTFDGRGVDFSWKHLWCGIDERLTIRGNTFRGSASLEIDATNLPIRPGNGPLITGNTFDGCYTAIGSQGAGATARVRGNMIRNIIGYGAAIGWGTPEFSGNTFEATGTVVHDMVRVGPNARPVFQHNVFVEPITLPYPPPVFQIRGPADFGGGGASVGGNDFSRLGAIYCAAPGEEIWLQSNIWRTAVPMDQVGIYAGTIVHL